MTIGDDATESEVLDLVASVNLVGVWRNITTASPTIDPFDDVISNEADREVAKAWEAHTSGLPAGKMNRHSVFAYGDKRTTAYVFDLCYGSRFSDGTFGVWYGGIEEETSIWESLHYLYRAAKPDLAGAKDGKIRHHRRMYKADLQTSRALDLRPICGTFSDISHPLDYSVARNFGQFAVAKKIALFQSPSVRNVGGCCLAAFDKACLLQDKIVFDYYVTFSDGSDEAIVERFGSQTIWTFPQLEWDKPMSP